MHRMQLRQRVPAISTNQRHDVNDISGRNAFSRTNHRLGGRRTLTNVHPGQI
jgi:hypothetical protein